VIFNGKIKELMTCDVSEVLSELPAFDSPLWSINKGRQEGCSIHTDTLNIIIKGVGKHWDGVPIQPKLYADYPAALTKAVCEIADKVGEVLNGMVTNATLIMLPAGKKVRLHKDFFPLNLVHRCHIPVVTNEESTFTLLTTNFKLEKGIVYEINNQLPHKAENNGSTPRIHLLVDVLPNANI
jgi:hypothetical protein